MILWAEDDVVNLSWQCGDSIRIVLRDHFLQDEDVASLTDNSTESLQALSGTKKLTRFADGWKADCPDAFVHFEVEGVTTDDWETLRRYVLTAEGW